MHYRRVRKAPSEEEHVTGVAPEADKHSLLSHKHAKGEEFTVSLIRGWRNHSMALERTWRERMAPQDIRDAALLDCATKVHPRARSVPRNPLSALNLRFALRLVAQIMRTVCAEEVALRRTHLLLEPLKAAGRTPPARLATAVDEAIVQSKRVEVAFERWHARHPPITNAEVRARLPRQAPLRAPPPPPPPALRDPRARARPGSHRSLPELL